MKIRTEFFSFRNRVVVIVVGVTLGALSLLYTIDMARRLKQILADSGFKFYLDSPTNQQFVIMPNDRIPALQKQVEFSVWGPMCDQESVCRFVTSWATTDDEMLQLEKILLDNK